MENQHSMYQSDDTRRVSVGKPTKKVEMVFNYAAPDPDRDNKIRIQVAQYFAKEIKRKRALFKPEK